MNTTEQRNHRTVTATIAKNLTHVAEASVSRFAEIERRIADEGRVLRGQIGDERTHRLKLADEQRAYVDRADREESEIRRRADEHLHDALAALRDRTFFGRMRWLLRGR